MYNKVKIFLNQDAYTELTGAYIDREGELRTKVRDAIRVLFKGAKMSKVNRKVIVNLKYTNDEEPDPKKKRQMKSEQVDYDQKELDKFELDHDDSWLPEGLTSEDCDVYEVNVRDNVWDYLLLFAKLYWFRLTEYNKALQKDEKKEIAEDPVCFEQVMHEQLLPSVMQLINSTIEEEFDNDFKKMDEEEAQKKKDKKPKAGSRDKKSKT